MKYAKAQAHTLTHTQIFDCLSVCVFAFLFPLRLARPAAAHVAHVWVLPLIHIQLAHVCVCVYLLIFLALLPHLHPLLLLVEIIRHGEDA